MATTNKKVLFLLQQGVSPVLGVLFFIVLFGFDASAQGRGRNQPQVYPMYPPYNANGYGQIYGQQPTSNNCFVGQTQFNSGRNNSYNVGVGGYGMNGGYSNGANYNATWSQPALICPPQPRRRW